VSECGRLRELHEVLNEVDGLMCRPTDSGPWDGAKTRMLRSREHPRLISSRGAPMAEPSPMESDALLTCARIPEPAKRLECFVIGRSSKVQALRHMLRRGAPGKLPPVPTNRQT
jgi:hypothetical protein